MVIELQLNGRFAVEGFCLFVSTTASKNTSAGDFYYPVPGLDNQPGNAGNPEDKFNQELCKFVSHLHHWSTILTFLHL